MFNGAKCNLGKVNLKTMLASGLNNQHMLWGVAPATPRGFISTHVINMKKLLQQYFV
jgi:hypothetical protein